MAKELTPLTEQDYGSIETAVMETARGRWFLNEYSKRNRNADTAVLLEAIKKLERSFEGGPAETSVEAPDELRLDLVEMAAAIAQTKREIASIHTEDGDESSISVAADELDAIVTATERATQGILEAAEQVQEVAWSMREIGVNEDYCEKLDALATDIYTACSFQDITGQRTSKVVGLLSYLEQRLDAMRHIWEGNDIAAAPRDASQGERPDAHLLNGPQHEGQGCDQSDIDIMMVDIREEFEIPSQAPAPQVATPASADGEDFVADEAEIIIETEATAPEPTALADVESEPTAPSPPQREPQRITVRKPLPDETAPSVDVASAPGEQWIEERLQKEREAGTGDADMLGLTQDEKTALFS